MSHRTEHKTALDDLNLDFVRGYTDLSWHNDIMPSFLVCGNEEEENEVKLWIDYANEEDRENEGNKRFMITYNYVDFFSTDDIDELKTFLNNQANWE